MEQDRRRAPFSKTLSPNQKRPGPECPPTPAPGSPPATSEIRVPFAIKKGMVDSGEEHTVQGKALLRGPWIGDEIKRGVLSEKVPTAFPASAQRCREVRPTAREMGSCTPIPTKGPGSSHTPGSGVTEAGGRAHVSHCMVDSELRSGDHNGEVMPLSILEANSGLEGWVEGVAKPWRCPGGGV